MTMKTSNRISWNFYEGIPERKIMKKCLKLSIDKFLRMPRRISEETLQNIFILNWKKSCETSGGTSQIFLRKKTPEKFPERFLAKSEEEFLKESLSKMSSEIADKGTGGVYEEIPLSISEGSWDGFLKERLVELLEKPLKQFSEKVVIQFVKGFLGGILWWTTEDIKKN